RPALRRAARGLTVALTTLSLLSVGSTAAQAAPTGSPRGHLDGVTATAEGVTVRGWAWDENTKAPVTVRVTVGDRTHEVKADEYRSDIAKAFSKAGSYRGFDDALAAAPGTYEVCAVAVNVGRGANTSLGCEQVNVLDLAPVGYLDQ